MLFTQLSLSIVALSAALVPRAAADAVPTAPGPGDSFNEGSACPIQWNLDTTGTWTNFTIQLMTGSNQAMTPLMTVVSGVDGTTGTGKYSWTCPEVTPNSAIYFYQFTQAGSATSWTTRFTIASASGETTEPTETVMVDGKPVGWGTGRLSGASADTSAAASGAGSSGAVTTATTTTSSASSSPSGMVTVVTTSSTDPATSTSTSTSTSSSSSSASSSSASSSSSSTSSQVVASGSSNAAAKSSTNGNGASSLLAGSRAVVVSGTALVALASLAMFA